MSKQFVIFGADRFGASIARTLEEHGCQVMILDNDEKRIQEIAEDVTMAEIANVEDPDVIRNLGIRNMDGAVISMVDHMEASVIAAMLCQELGITYVVARARGEMHARILQKIGVNKVVFPEQEMGERIGQFLAEQNFLDFIALSDEYGIVELAVKKEWAGKSLTELNLRGTYGINVIAVKHDDRINMDVSPTAPLQSRDELIVVGSNENLSHLQD